MSSGKISHEKAWNEIATIMSGKGYNVSGRQCMTRINTMKRTYKTIKDHNAKSGNNKRTWKYYEIMQSFLGEKPYMAPLATISSTGSVSKRSISPSSMSTCEPDEINRKRKASSTDVAEKLIESRRLIEERKERKHMEKIELQTKLLEKLDKFIEKIIYAEYFIRKMGKLYYLIQRNQDYRVHTNKGIKKTDIILARHGNRDILHNITNNLNMKIPYVYVRRLNKGMDETHFKKRQLPIIIEQKILNNVQIKVIKNKLNVNHKQRKRKDQIKILNNNFEKNKSEIKVETEKIEENKINLDILRNNDSDGTNDCIDEKNKNIRLHGILQAESSYAASKTYALQNNCEDRNKDNRNETTIEVKMKDKSDMCLDIILQKDENKNNDNHEIRKKRKLISYNNDQSKSGDADPFLLAAFNRAFYKNLPNNENYDKNIITNNKENESKVIIMESEMCRYNSAESNLHLSAFEDSSLEQIKSNHNNEEDKNSLLNHTDINNMSFIIDESMLLNSTYTIENFPELDNIIEKLESTRQAEDKLEEEQSFENIRDDNNLDENYEPSEDSTSDSDYESNDDDLNNELKNENELNTSNNLRRSTLNLSSTANATGTSGCDDAQLTIDHSCNGTKKYYCLYCKLPNSKIARHLENVHRNEDVKKFAQLPKGCPERKKIIETIRREGEFQFNTNRMLNDGKLHVVRRPNIKFNKKGTEYGVCIKCHGFFSKSTLRNHTRKCVNLKHSKNRTITVLGRTILGRINEIACQTLKKVIFPVLREDSITRLIRYDELIIRYGNKLCMKYKPQHQHDMVRNRLRTLGRFLKASKNINNEITDFASLYQPKYYDDCIKAVYEVARYNPETQKFGAASTAFQLGTLLKEVGELWRSQCIKNHDSIKKILVEDFLSLRKEDFGHSVNKTVMETRAHITRQKVEVAPSISDIKKLYNYVNTKRCEAYNLLKEKFSYNIWQTLGKSTLISMQIYNRKRAGEIQRILLEDFYTYEGLNEQSDPDLFKTLSDSAKEIARKYVRFQIRGKLGRPVLVLIQCDVLDGIQLFIQCRNQANVHPKNPYVFGISGFTKQRFKYLRACDQMRKFAYECGAEHPERLRGTLLRKHIATNCHKLKLTEYEISELANFMGHKEDIHKKFYRLPQKEADILNISKYLEAALGKNSSKDDTHDNDNDISYNNSDITLNDTNTDDDPANNSLNDANTDDDLANNSLNDINTDDDLANNNFDNDNMQESSYLSTNSSRIPKRQKNKITKGSKKLYKKNETQLKCKRTRWSNAEKDIVLIQFGTYLNTYKCPLFKEIAALIAANPCLQTRTVYQIKSWFNNQQKILRTF